MSITVRIKDKNNIPKLIKVLRDLQRTKLEIGVFGKDNSDILMIARVHEFGVTIEPKNAKWLTIPLSAAKGKKPADFGDELFIPHGTHVLARKKGNDGFEPLFVLTKSVKIPERSFMRAGFDAHLDDIYKTASKLLDKVLHLELNVDNFFEVLGTFIVSRIQEYLTDLDDPPNAAMTIEQKGSANPLIDTGRLRQAITYRVVR